MNSLNFVGTCSSIRSSVRKLLSVQACVTCKGVRTLKFTSHRGFTCKDIVIQVPSQASSSGGVGMMEWLHRKSHRGRFRRERFPVAGEERRRVVGASNRRTGVGEVR